MADENVEEAIQFDIRPGENETKLEGEDWTATVEGVSTKFNAVRLLKNDAGEVVAVQLVKYTRA